MVPEFRDNGRLPPGIHVATWPEFCKRFGATPYRRVLIAGLRKALFLLRRAGCMLVYIDGSFVTDTEMPRDYDACWDVTGVNPTLLDPTLLSFANRRAAQKAKFCGEFLPAQATEGGSGLAFLDFFQVDKETGGPKGIVAIELGSAEL